MTDPVTVPELLEVMPVDACRRLLAATEVGRLAVVVEGGPRIVVLNHIVTGDVVLFRTAEDSLLSRLTAADVELPAVYEVDSAFPVTRSGWSVIVSGVLTREYDPALVSRARESIDAWARGNRDTVLRLSVDEVSGRRVGEL